MKTLLALSLLSSSLSFAAALPQGADKLAVNDVKAVYMGTVEHRCKGRTRDCPDRCGHSTKLAVFRVLENRRYEKNGEYGDDKADKGEMIYVDMLKDIPGQDSEKVLKQISGMEAGACVDMEVTHYYIDNEHCAYPVRPVTKLELLKEKQDVPALKASDAPHFGIMPLGR